MTHIIVIHVIRKNKSIKNLNIGGGVSIYIQEHLNVNTLDNLTYSLPDFVDIVSISMLINNKQTIISGIYKSPNSDIKRL